MDRQEHIRIKADVTWRRRDSISLLCFLQGRGPSSWVGENAEAEKRGRERD